MGITFIKSLAECAAPQEAIRELCAAFAGSAFPGAVCDEVPAEQMPEECRRLLVHRNHMTIALQEFYGSRPVLKVIEQRREGDVYTRKIILTRPNRPEPIELGVARLHLQHLPREAQDQILQQREPLGAILIRHRLHRRVRPRWFLRFPPDSPVLGWFGFAPAGGCYGRIATIFCNDEPTVELMEISTWTGTLETDTQNKNDTKDRI